MAILQVTTVPATAASIPALVARLSDPSDPRGRYEAAATLATLARRADLTKPILRTVNTDLKRHVAVASLPALVSLLQDTSNPEGRANAAGALRILARKDGFGNPIADAALPALVSLLQDISNPVGRADAAAAFQTLADNANLRMSIAHAAMPALVSLLQDTSNPVGRTEAARTLLNLQVHADL